MSDGKSMGHVASSDLAFSLHNDAFKKYFVNHKCDKLFVFTVQTYYILLWLLYETYYILLWLLYERTTK